MEFVEFLAKNEVSNKKISKKKIEIISSSVLPLLLLS